MKLIKFINLIYYKILLKIYFNKHNMLFKFLSKVDFLSFKPQFYTKGEERHKTIFGGVMQILLLILNITFIIYFSKDIYQKINPIVVKSDGMEVYKSQVDFPRVSSIFLSLIDPETNMPFIDESIYKLKFYHNVMDPKTGLEKQEIEAERCERDSFDEILPENILDSFTWENFYCISRGQNVTLKGSYLDSGNWYLSAEVTPCEGPKCSSQENIEKKLLNTYLQIFLIDKYFDLLNFSQPVQFFSRMFKLPIMSNQKFSGILRYKLVNLIDDVGLIFQDIKQRSVYAFNGMEKLILPPDKTRKVLFELVIQQCTYIENISRNYKKLQEVIASVGGIINVIILITKSFVKFITESLYYKSLYLCFFNYTYIEKKPNLPKASTDPADRSNFSHTQQNIFGIEPFSGIINNYMRPKKILTENQIVNKNNNLKFFKQKSTNISTREGVSYTMNKKKCQDFFKSSMDFTFILNKFKELEILKLVLFTDTQYSKFDSLVKNKTSTEILINNFIDKFECSNYREENVIISQKLKKLEDLLS
jgi:hypothetical protein